MSLEKPRGFAEMRKMRADFRKNGNGEGAGYEDVRPSQTQPIGSPELLPCTKCKGLSETYHEPSRWFVHRRNASLRYTAEAGSGHLQLKPEPYHLWMRFSICPAKFELGFALGMNFKEWFTP